MTLSWFHPTAKALVLKERGTKGFPKTLDVWGTTGEGQH